MGNQIRAALSLNAKSIFHSTKVKLINKSFFYLNEKWIKCIINCNYLLHGFNKSSREDQFF